MLVLGRRVGEKIVIGDEIVVTVVEVHRDSVRLGVDAPRSVPVNRAELLQAVSEENAAALSDTEAAMDSFKGIKPSAEGRKVDIKALMQGKKPAAFGSAPTLVSKPSAIKPKPQAE